MKTIAWRFVMSLLVSSASYATASLAPENPYHSIVLRNPFQLRPMVVTTPEPVPQARPEIKLTGITIINGQKKAWFTVAAKDSKGTPTFLSLVEKERKDMLEIIRISDTNNEVEAREEGVTTSIVFKLKSF